MTDKRLAEIEARVKWTECADKSGGEEATMRDVDYDWLASRLRAAMTVVEAARVYVERSEKWHGTARMDGPLTLEENDEYDCLLDAKDEYHAALAALEADDDND